MLCFILWLAILTSCRSHEEIRSKPLWEVIELKGEGEVNSFYGNINQSILVGTRFNVLKSVDKGKSWKKVLMVDDQVREFINKNDTTFALTYSTDYYSLNNGDTWYKLGTDLTPTISITMKNSENILYKLQQNSDGELAVPSFVLKSNNGGINWVNIFPYKHYIYSIYLDNENRLYLGINGWIWDDKTGGFETSSNNNALIYHLKYGLL